MENWHRNSFIKGRDGIIRAARVRTKNTVVGRAVELFFPLELTCEEKDIQAKQLNPEAEQYRPRRKAAQAASETVK